MAWTTPVDWTVGQMLTSTDLNKVNANLNALKTPPSDVKKGAGPSNFTTSSTTFVVVDSSLNISLTTTGGDILIGFTGVLATGGGSTTTIDFDIDGVRMGAYSTGGGLMIAGSGTVTTVALANGITAGTHSIKLVWKVNTGGASLYNGLSAIPVFWAREV